MAEIHEFSTGIRVEYTKVGGYQWILQGFTGQWMNSTLAQIPDGVDRSIKNEQFAVSGAVSSQNPAIVGRVVLDSQYQENWSVVALITDGFDEHGRNVQVYRYFLCKGREGLGIILAWINDYKQRNGRMPFFNPGETKTIGQQNEYTGTARKVNLAQSTRELLNDTIPIIVAPPKIDLAIVNEIAVEKNPQSASWAYNVESINRPENFTVIQTASDAAYNRLLQNKQNSYSGYYLPPGNGYTQSINLSSEQPVETIKEVIKKIKDGNRVELTDVQDLANVIESITKENSYNIFDVLGARDAIKKEIKIPEMVRLLTLRAMIIPETLPEYLDWLSIEGSSRKGLLLKGLWSKIIRKKNREKTEQAESRKFQSQITQYLESFPIFKQYLVEGIKIVLNQLRKKNVAIEATWLLKVKQGAWSYYMPQTIKDIQNDLGLVESSSKSITHQNQPVSEPNYLCGNQIWVELQKFYLQGCKYKVPTYKNFAELFERLSLGKVGLSAQLSAYFYQVSYGHVPKKVFTQAGLKEWRGEVFGFKVDRKVTILEKVLRYVDDHIVLLTRLALVVGILFLPIISLQEKLAMIAFAAIILSVSPIFDYVKGNYILNSLLNKTIITLYALIILVNVSIVVGKAIEEVLPKISFPSFPRPAKTQPPVSPLSPEQVSQMAQEFTVLIDGYESGSGVIFQRDGNTYSVLTAKHAVNATKKYLVITPDRELHKVNSTNIQPIGGLDLAVVKFRSKETYRVAELGNSEQIIAGKRVYVAGAPEPSEVIQTRITVVTPGNIVAALEQPLDSGYALIYTNTTSRGMSGGPVLDEKGRVIGIHGKGDRKDGNKTGLNLGIPISKSLASRLLGR